MKKTRSILLLLLSMGMSTLAMGQGPVLHVPGGLIGSILGNNVGIGTTNPASLLSVRGPIESAAVFGSPGSGGTVLYGATSESGLPTDDGFRFRWDPDFFASYNDALIFEKTDGNNAQPDAGASGFAFVNTGNTDSLGPNNDATALVIKGNGRVGIGNIFGPNQLGIVQLPGNTLEIQGDPNSLGNASGASGLRFRNLNSTSPQTALAPGQGLLSVNAQGDVMYVPSPSASYIGLCSALPALPSDAGMNLNGNDFYFQGGLGNVGIGFACGSIINARLSVQTANQRTGSRSLVNTPGSGGSNFAFLGDATGSGLANFGGGLTGSGTMGLWNFGLAAIGRDAILSNYGVRASAGSCTPAILSNSNCAVYAEACPGKLQSYGIYAKAPGCGSFSNHWAGYFQGDVFVSCGLMVASDAKLKKEIQPIENATQILEKLNPKTYFFRTDEYQALNLPCHKQFGLLAQEVEQVIPEAVKDVHQPEQLDSAGNVIASAVDFKSINYNAIVPIMLQAIKEQQETIAADQEHMKLLQKQLAEMQSQMDALSSRVAGCCKGSSLPDDASGLNDPRSAAPSWLEQNVPNPFSESTVVRYFVANASGETYLSIKSVLGVELAKFPILESGAGEVQLSAGSFPAGTYLYALVVNGKPVDVKRMVIAK